MDLPRSSGVLLHLTSLPSPYGIGDLGPAAYRFVDFLVAAGQRVWQVLPLNPVGYGYSPYASPSTFAGNPLLISPERLLEQGLLADEDFHDEPYFPAKRVDYEEVIPFRKRLLRRCYERFEADRSLLDESAFWTFCEQNAFWLDDYALFMALKEAYEDGPWTAWPLPLRRRHADALEEARRQHEQVMQRHRFWQFLFVQQWADLRAYCHRHDVRLFGDLPIYVAHDSADVWARQELFYLDEDGHPTVVAGVPPDYFSETGQRWGNPLYRWDVMRENGYLWWVARLRTMLGLVDLIRLDHFRAFAAYWEIPADEETAVNGQWVEGPGAALFETVRHALGELPLVAEDLGLITEEVPALMEEVGLPGMAVLQFAFGDDVTSDYLPHNFKQRLAAYTGTHDNDTILGWWKDPSGSGDEKASARAHAFARLYFDFDENREDDLHWTFVRAILASVADYALFPLQDLLGLGSKARMNTPGAGQNNWAWRYTPDQLTDDVGRRLKQLTQLYGRTDEPEPPIDVKTRAAEPSREEATVKPA